MIPENPFTSWLPALVLGFGVYLSSGASAPTPVPLNMPLDVALIEEVPGFTSVPVPISEEELEVAGVTSYFNRIYDEEVLDIESPSEGTPDVDSRPKKPLGTWFSLYVGYYDHQVRGHTIHSPKNCLPGAGWEALDATLTQLDGPAGPIVANRYVLQREDERVLAYYWYQGRNRIEADEFRVKWNLLWDAAFRGRTEEALVRVVVPVAPDTPESEADVLASELVQWVVPRLDRALPES